MEKNINPYAPPKSSIKPESTTIGEATYFTTSTSKLAWMSLCTFGFYELYWFYKNWVLIKERTGGNIMPFWRAFFAPIWAYYCFEHMKNSAIDNDIPVSVPINLIAIIYFLLQFVWLRPDPYWLFSYFSFMLLIPVNSVALKVNKHLVADFKNNETYSRWNWVALDLGGLLLVLVLVVIFVPRV